jgi:hypothetical protein
MKVEMLKARNYRGQHCDAGLVLDMDQQTAAWFIEKGWACKAVEPAPLTTEQADALIPKQDKRRRAVR